MAKLCFLKSKTIWHQNRNTIAEATNLINLANVFIEEQKSDSAKINYEKGIQLAEITKSDNLIADGISGLGKVYLIKKDHSKARQYLEEGLVLYEKAGAKDKYLESLLTLAYLYDKEKEYAKTIMLSKKILELMKLSNRSRYEQETLEYLFTSYAQVKDYENAYHYQTRYMNLKDSILSETHIKNINELQIKFETNEKEKENKLLASKNEIQTLKLKQNRYLVFGLVSILLIGLIVTILVIRQNKLRSQQQATTLEQKLLRSQMNPHFIFNSLASIESFIYEHEPKEAGLYLSQFSRLMRLILENSAAEYIPLEKEIETLNYYLSLQKLRMYDKFNYTIDVDPSLQSQQIDIPPMLTQPFIENAIEHGFKGSKQEGLIIVKFSLNQDVLQVEITDNGIGIIKAEKQKELHTSHKSMAINITKERLLFLNKSKKQKMAFAMTDLSLESNQQQGTKITFSIPV